MKLATRRLATITALAVVPVLTLGTAASATQTAMYKCQATAVGQTADFTLNQDLDASAPATVAAGGAVAVVIDPASNQIPGSAGGYTIKNVQDLSLNIPVPANATFVSATLVGGSGLNSTPTVALSGSNVVLSVPGPVNGGSTFELPTITLNLTAGGSGTITSQLGGTSLDDPGLTVTANVNGPLGIPISAPAKCYPDPNPTLTTTTIG
ncbi:cyclase [Fodinicola feengrottensis]|uniref:Cyclase n=1 Tax=Fodinicola feengrottensis TaxID=435914 RepID=A0ABN2IMQ3_9ACTN